MAMKRRVHAKRKVFLTKPELAEIDSCVRRFKAKKGLFQGAADAVVSAFLNDPDLKKFIHFITYRLKDPTHLRAKLRKRALKDKKND